MFRCNLPPALSAEWPSLFHATAVTRGWNGHRIRISTQRRVWRRKFSRSFRWDSNLQLFDHKSGTVTSKPGTGTLSLSWACRLWCATQAQWILLLWACLAAPAVWAYKVHCGYVKLVVIPWLWRHTESTVGSVEYTRSCVALTSIAMGRSQSYGISVGCHVFTQWVYEGWLRWCECMMKSDEDSVVCLVPIPMGFWRVTEVMRTYEAWRKQCNLSHPRLTGYRF